MAEILEARVIQKVGTEAEWLANPLPLLDGEAAIVRTGDGTPVNLKFGDGGKTFAELPYFIDYSQAAYIAYTASPTQPVAYTFVGEGTYGAIAVTPGYMAVLGWDGTSWSKNAEMELPTADVSNKLDTGGYTGTAQDLNTKIDSIDSLSVNSGKDFPLKGYPTNSSFLDRLTKVRNAILSFEVVSTDVDTMVYTIYSLRKGSTQDTTIGVFKRSRADRSVITGKFNFTSSDATLGEKNLAELNKLKNSTTPVRITLVNYSAGFEISMVIDGSKLVADEALVLGNTSDTDPAVNDIWKDFVFVDATHKMKFAEPDSEAYKKLIIGIDSPKVYTNQYIDVNGNVVNNASLSFKKYQIVKGSLPRIRIVGSSRFTAPLYIAQFNSDVLSSATFISGKKGTSSTLTPIDEWVDIDPNTVSFTLGYANTNGSMNIGDMSAQKSSSSPVVSGSNVYRYELSDIGAIPYFLDLFGYDYLHIIMYGQSLSEGNNPAQPVTTVEIANDLMAGTMPDVTGDLNITALNPIKSVAGRGESPIVTATHHFAKMLRRHKIAGQKVIGNSCGQSSRSIEVLSKESTNYNYYSGGTSAGTNTYTNRFLNLITKTKTVINGLSKTIACPAIIWMQGENNYATGDQGLTVGTGQTNDKNTYKSLLLTLKNNMQADIMATYGQSETPMFFIYQTGRDWTVGKEQAITMAQIEFARENDDVILLNPVYPVPGMMPTSDHMSENGSRWYGELIGKSLYQTLIKGKDYNAITLEKTLVVDKSTIDLVFKVPVEPLVIDTNSTKPQVNYGFEVYSGGVSQGISSISVVNSNTIRISMVADLPVGQVDVSYANKNTEGRGNLRDSDTYKGMFDYTDYTSVSTAPEEFVAKDENGVSLYGKPYPLFNWLQHIYVTMNVS